MSDYNHYRSFGISRDVFELSEEAMRQARDTYIASIVKEKRRSKFFTPSWKLAFRESTFMAKTGYGYGDVGRR